MAGVEAVGAPDARPFLSGRRLRGLVGVRLLDGALADLRIEASRIVAVTPHDPAGPAAAEAGVLDATGWRFVPAATEPHAHLDKALTGPRVDPGAGNDLLSAIAQWRAIAADIDAADLRARASGALGRYLRHGITTVRTHVDVLTSGEPLRGVEVMLGLRDRFADRMRLQVCLLAGPTIPDGLIREAIGAGIDVLGGCPHLADDPVAETTRLLDLAEESGLPVDLHTDEQTDPVRVDLVDLAEQVLARGLEQRVSASHCVRLGMLEPDRLARTLDLVKRAGLGVITLPITNLYLQGRPVSAYDGVVPRGLPPLRAILDAQIPLAAGADNLRDPFNPVGRADPFETTSLLVTAGHLSPREALAAVTSGGRTVLGEPPVGAELDRVGSLGGGPATTSADLMLVPDVPLDDVLAGGQTARVVVHGGRVVADTRVSTSLDLPDLDPEPDPEPDPLSLDNRSFEISK
ncbi:MAG: amidohydrolase family protein [Nocardioides sp.]|uniref:amidohydrolase family protein n=1 Tax=Nocardioides sp. TaxID=35761 RepID=UPI0039E41632